MKITTGCTININRSDGRVHPAIVVAINYEGKFVRVEWLEGGETKGKDLDFSVASIINPDISFSNSPRKTKQSIDDSVIHKQQQRRTGNFRKTRIQTGGKSASNESFSQIYSSRSLYENLRNKNPVIKELSVYDSNKKTKSEKNDLISKNKNFRKNFHNVKSYSQLAEMVAQCRAKLISTPLSFDDIVEDHLITVCVRKRPLNKFELAKNEVDIISIPRKNTLIVHEPKNKVDLTKFIENHNFKFDYAFDEECNNVMVYKYTAQPLVRTIFEGGFATCFAYGQTGSGKTYTMSGADTGKETGVYALAISDVFKLMNTPKYSYLNLTVYCSFFEIYSGKVFDLLNSKRMLKILEDGKQQVQVVGLKEKLVTDPKDVLIAITKGDNIRTSGQTSANTNSSRSHAVFQIYLRKKNGLLHGKLSLIDLAGNERGADTFSSDRQTRLEGGEINKSLLALKECIRALGRKGAHLPFRVSKLTQVLRDSFVGNNSRTCMIAMVSPSITSCENTLNTLRYADRVKELGTSDAVSESATTTTNSLDITKNIPMEIEEVESKHFTELENSQNRLFNYHRNMTKKLTELAKEGQNLLKMIDDYDFDGKFYVRKFEELIDNILSNLLVTKDFIDDYKNKLNKI